MDLSVGAAFLGTGGGGDPYIGRLMVQKCMADGQEVIDPRSRGGSRMTGLVLPDRADGRAHRPGREAARAVGPRRSHSAAASWRSYLRPPQGAGHHADRGWAASIRPFRWLVGARALACRIVDADGMGRAFLRTPRWRRSESTAIFGHAAGGQQRIWRLPR